MADRYFSVNFGQDKTQVAETGSSTAAAHVEVRITYDATNNGKTAALLALEHLTARILADNWPPV
jgi:hypothetical protein